MKSSLRDEITSHPEEGECHLPKDRSLEMLLPNCNIIIHLSVGEEQPLPEKSSREKLGAIRKLVLSYCAEETTPRFFSGAGANLPPCDSPVK